MPDFLHFPKRSKVLITESTKKLVEKDLEEKLEDLDEDELVEKVNKGKKAVARRTKKGVSIKQSLNG